VVDGKIYAMGGGESPSNTSYKDFESYSTVEEYDPATDIWTAKSDMPRTRGFHSSIAVDGKIYVIGGSLSYPWSGIWELDVYDPATDTWTLTAVSRPIINGFTTVVDGKIYAIGGEFDGNGQRVDEYNPVTNTWTEKADMPTPRSDLSGSVLDDKIYAIGGDSGEEIVATVEVYDPATDTWTAGDDLSIARAGIRTCVVDGKIYAIGGLTRWNVNPTGAVEVYDK